MKIQLVNGVTAKVEQKERFKDTSRIQLTKQKL